jgi:Tfp pilus assembly protein FimT
MIGHNRKSHVIPATTGFKPHYRKAKAAVKVGRGLGSSSGFSVSEAMVVCAIIMLIVAISGLALAPMRDSAKVNSAVQITVNQLRLAHEEAIAKRLQYVVTLQRPGTILTQWTKTGIGLQTERSVPLPGGIQFTVVNGIPTAVGTPDGFGNGQVAIDLDQATGGGGNVIYFQPDGTAVDAAGNPNNGVVYIAIPGQLPTSRAITLFGSTGRLKTWRLSRQGANVKWQ